MSLFNSISDLFGGGDDTLDIESLTLDDLNQEKAEIRADVKLKRDRHEDLADKRENLFEKIVETDDEMLQTELAEEIASIEDEMAILHNEHAQLMDALRVVDGLIAIKRKERMAEQEGLISKIRNMDKQSVMETLRRADVREMIREEKWDQLNSLMSGQLSPKERDSERVNQILDQAEDVKQLKDEMGTKDAVKSALKERDAKREKEEADLDV